MSSLSWAGRWHLVRFLLPILTLITISTHASGNTEAGARALQSRLYAPCCYGGTLDTHESQLSRDLRREIRDRMARGESGERIQADFVDRYGERVLAARSDKPIATMGLVLLGVIVAAGLAMALRVRHWVRALPGQATVERAGLSADESEKLDARIDQELLHFE